MKLRFIKKSIFLIKILIFLFGINKIFALPQDPIIELGEANFDNSLLKELSITTSDKAVINWGEFSINYDEIARFIQPTENSIVLNRVIGETKSEISGLLQANGNIFIINQNGFFFAKDSIVDTNSFTASTLDVLNEAVLENKEINFTGESQESIINLGVIKAKDGDVALLGFLIDNQGLLKAPKGDVILACGNEILLSPKSDEKVFIKPKIREKESNKEIGINNSGVIEAIQTKMIAEGNPYQYAIKHSGEIDALGLAQKDGKVYLIADNGANIIDGKITCKNEDETGGYVCLLGESVQLLDNANINVSSDFDGGEVLIGGDCQGVNPGIINAKAVYVGEKANINASSLVDGRGGRVILWSDELTQFYGNILAQGGKTKGDGGFVEISSLGFLDPNGKVSTKSYFGEKGTLLLDPPDVIISTDIAVQSAPPPPAVGGGGPYIYSFSGVNPKINNNVLISYLNDGHVIIDTSTGNQGTTGTITVKDSVVWNAPTSLTMIAGVSININAPVRNSNLTIPGITKVMEARAPTINIGNSVTSVVNTGFFASSGLIRIQAPILLGLYGGVGVLESKARIQAGTAPLVPGSIEATVGDIVLSGNLATLDSSASIYCAGAGDMTINATGDVTFTGGAGAQSFAAFQSTTGNIYLNMTGNNKTLLFQGGSGASSAVINTLVNGNIIINMTGANSNCVLMAGNSVGVDSSALIGTGSIGNILINITGDYFILGGNVTGVGNPIAGAAGFATGFTGNGGDITLFGRNYYLIGGGQPVSNSAFCLAQNGDLNVNATGSIVMQAGTADDTSAIMTTSGAGQYNVRINANSFSMLGSSTPIINAGVGVATAVGDIEVNVIEDVIIRGGGGAGSFAGIFIFNTGNIDVLANNLSMQSGTGDIAEIVTPSGDINIALSGAFNMKGTAGNVALIETQGSDMLLRFGSNFTMGDFSSINNGGAGDLTIIVDDNFSAAPDFGAGSFNMASTATLSTANGDLRVFSSRQSLNSINGFLNGLPFVAGTLFKDTTQEIWGTYYPSILGGIPFTIFYKDTPSVLVFLAEPLLIAFAEMFRDLHPYGEFLKSDLQFSVGYDIKTYAQVAGYEKYKKYFIRKRDREEVNIHIPRQELGTEASTALK